MQGRGQWMLILLVLLLGTQGLKAQPLTTLTSRYQSAYAARDFSQAGELWRKIYQKSPEQAALLDFELAVLTDPEAPGPGTWDTLIALYSKPHPENPSVKKRWLHQRAILAAQLPAAYPDRAVMWLLEGLEAHPEGELDYLEGSMIGALAPAYRSSLVGRSGIIGIWMRLDRYLYLRELRAGLSTSVNSRRLRIREEVIQLVGGCNALSTLKTGMDAYFALALCPQSLSRSLDETPALEMEHPGWTMRILSRDLQNMNQVEDALDVMLRGAELETDPWLKSDMMVQAALYQVELKAYVQARKTLMNARQTAPNWPIPYIELAQLYVHSSQECNFSAFDQQAVYWLALDQLQAIAGRLEKPDSYLEQMILTYRKQAPTEKAVRFMGLQMGATYPIKCWMHGVTTVRIYQ